jgi:hypothetical protein
VADIGSGSESAPRKRADARRNEKTPLEVDRLVPVRAELLGAAAGAGEIRPDIEALDPVRGVGNLCIGANEDPRYDARRVVGVLLAGLRLHQGPRRARGAGAARPEAPP